MIFGFLVLLVIIKRFKLLFCLFDPLSKILTHGRARRIWNFVICSIGGQVLNAYSKKTILRFYEFYPSSHRIGQSRKVSVVKCRYYLLIFLRLECPSLIIIWVLHGSP
eukprot:UN02804